MLERYETRKEARSRIHITTFDDILVFIVNLSMFRPVLQVFTGIFGKVKQEEYTFFHKQHERGIIHRNCFHNFHFSCFISPKIICEVGIFWEHSSFFFIFAISARSILFWCFDYRNAVIFRWMREGWKCQSVSILRKAYFSRKSQIIELNIRLILDVDSKIRYNRSSHSHRFQGGH